MSSDLCTVVLVEIKICSVVGGTRGHSYFFVFFSTFFIKILCKILQKNRRKIKIFKIKFVILSRYLKKENILDDFRNFYNTFDLKDAIVILNKKYLTIQILTIKLKTYSKE